jgi:hypothetical protein
VNDEVIKYYEMLGVAPGASAQELKAAHRDLAKVWHPDRFAHDPRLQQKAQEKLKEINEAYDQLKAGKTGRRTHASSQTTSPTNQSSTSSNTRSRRISWKFILLPALAFALIFFAAFRAFIPAGQQRTQSPVAQAEQAQASQDEEAQSSPSDSSVKPPASEAARGKRLEQQPAREAKPGDAPVTEQETRQMRPLPTVTVAIDPMSGMLATPACPAKSRMTYPSGAEPRAYCNLSHKSAAPAQADEARPKESRLKTFAKRLSPARLFGGKGNSDDGSSKQEGKTP